MSDKQVIDVRGKNIPWRVTSGGVFCAEMAGEEYEAETLKKLASVLRETAKKTPLDIPFVQVGGRWRDDDLDLKRGVITGIHSGNRNLLARYEDGETEQLSSRHGLMHGDVDIATLTNLFNAKKAAIDAYEKFLRDNEVEVPGA